MTVPEMFRHMSPAVTSPIKPRLVSNARGFTLLEVLVVVFIIGLVVTFAGLSIKQSASRELSTEANRLHELLRLASEEAVLNGQELALQLGTQSYRFLRLDGDGWQSVEEDRVLRERPFPPGVQIKLRLEGVLVNLEDESHPARILLLSSGELTPFELIMENGEGSQVILRGDIGGGVMLEQGVTDA